MPRRPRAPRRPRTIGGGSGPCPLSRPARSLRAFLARRSGGLYRLDRLGGTEYPARAILGFDGEARLIGVQRHGGLEAPAGGRASGLEPLGTATGEHLPGVYLRRPVPTDVERHLLFGPRLGHDRGHVLRLTVPREAEGPVGLDLRGEAGIEEQFAVVGKLGEERLAAPPDEHVTVGQNLHVALGGREYLVRVRVLTDQGGAHFIFVDLDHDAAGLHVLVDPAVVEDRYPSVGMATGIVLPVGPGAVSHLEVAPLPAQTPVDLARLSVDLVHGGSPTGRDGQVSVGMRVHGVDVEVVEGSL